MTAGKTTAQVFGLFGLLATAISLGFTAADVAAQEVAPKIMNAGGRRFTPKTAPTATKRQARVTEVRRRRRCTDVITSTCVFVIGLFLVLVLSLPAHPHAVKAAFPGFQLPTIPASSKRQPISRMLNRKNRLWFIAEHLIRNGG